MMHSNSKPFDERYQEYARDESRLTGTAADISFPRTQEELFELLCYFGQGDTPVCVQGARTGITGAAVPKGGHILNMTRMNKITRIRAARDNFLLDAEPGVTLAELNEKLAAKHFSAQDMADTDPEDERAFCDAGDFFFPPDPTEETATLGGMFSTNAEGINGYYYGKTAAYVEELSILLPAGDLWHVRRGEFTAGKNGCPLPDGSTLPLSYPQREVIRPYVISPGTDLIDIFAGSDGLFGVVVSLTLRLLPAVPERWDILCFTDEWRQAVRLGETLSGITFSGAAISAIEFFDRSALDMITGHKKNASALQGTPGIPAGARAALYLTMEGNDADSVENALAGLLETLQEYGIAEDETFAASGTAELDKMRAFRHGAPESVNAAIDRNRQAEPEITKISADFLIPPGQTEQFIERYLADIAASGIEGTVFGHLGARHPHVNLLPRDKAEIQRAKALMEQWAKAVFLSGGSFYGENGMGRTAKELFLKYAPEETLHMRRAIKSHFDPHHILNPWNMP